MEEEGETAWETHCVLMAGGVGLCYPSCAAGSTFQNGGGIERPAEQVSVCPGSNILGGFDFEYPN